MQISLTNPRYVNNVVKEYTTTFNQFYKSMKQLFLSLILVLMSVMVSMPASATTGKDVKNMVPQNIIVKQTTRFSDGRTLTLYYKKQGNQCEVYSPCNDKDYYVNDAKKIRSTNFEVVDKVEGKLYRKATVNEMLSILKKLLNSYI